MRPSNYPLPGGGTAVELSIVATAGHAIPPDGERYMAVRAGAQPIDVDASHSIALSQPKAVADLIQTAATAVSTETTTG